MLKSMEGQSGLSELSVISWVSAIQGCPFSGVPLYFGPKMDHREACPQTPLAAVCFTATGLLPHQLAKAQYTCRVDQGRPVDSVS